MDNADKRRHSVFKIAAVRSVSFSKKLILLSARCGCWPLGDKAREHQKKTVLEKNQETDNR
jgi:hypothetical protein